MLEGSRGLSSSSVPTQPLPFHGAQGDQKGAGCSQSPTTRLSLGSGLGEDQTFLQATQALATCGLLADSLRAASVMPWR